MLADVCRLGVEWLHTTEFELLRFSTPRDLRAHTASTRRLFVFVLRAISRLRLNGMLPSRDRCQWQRASGVSNAVTVELTPFAALLDVDECGSLSQAHADSTRSSLSHRFIEITSTIKYEYPDGLTLILFQSPLVHFVERRTFADLTGFKVSVNWEAFPAFLLVLGNILGGD